jgi:hypothetical protein
MPAKKGPKVTKSGAPDMRYASNRKRAGLGSGSTIQAPLTKDGKPDMRYNRNKAAVAYVPPPVGVVSAVRMEMISVEVTSVVCASGANGHRFG